MGYLCLMSLQVVAGVAGARQCLWGVNCLMLQYVLQHRIYAARFHKDGGGEEDMRLPAPYTREAFATMPRELSEAFKLIPTHIGCASPPPPPAVSSIPVPAAPGSSAQATHCLLPAAVSRHQWHGVTNHCTAHSSRCIANQFIPHRHIPRARCHTPL